MITKFISTLSAVAFEIAISTAQRLAHQNSMDHGFWDTSDDAAEFGARYARAHAVLSERLEQERKGRSANYVEALNEIARALEEPIGARLNKPEAVIALKLALVHSEVSEAYSGIRTNLGEELADIIIRIFDLAGHERINLAREILTKMRVNQARPHKHGKKF